MECVDEDGVPDLCDNCLVLYNPDQDDDEEEFGADLTCGTPDDNIALYEVDADSGAVRFCPDNGMLMIRAAAKPQINLSMTSSFGDFIGPVQADSLLEWSIRYAGLLIECP